MRIYQDAEAVRRAADRAVREGPLREGMQGPWLHARVWVAARDREEAEAAVHDVSGLAVQVARFVELADGPGGFLCAGRSAVATRPRGVRIRCPSLAEDAHAMVFTFRRNWRMASIAIVVAVAGSLMLWLSLQPGVTHPPLAPPEAPAVIAPSADATIGAMDSTDRIEVVLPADLPSTDGAVPSVRTLASTMRPIDPTSSVELAYRAVIYEPSAKNLRAFLDTAAQELRERRLDSARQATADRPEAAESRRQLLLRLLTATEYARSQGMLTAGEGDQGLWTTALAMLTDASPPGQPADDNGDLREAALDVVERRLAANLASEARWREQVASLTEVDEAAVHWARGLLDLALERVARQARAGDFEGYASRFLGLPTFGAPADREREVDYRRRRVEEFRQLLGSPR